MGVSLDTFKKTFEEFATQIKDFLPSNGEIIDGDGILITKQEDGSITISVDDTNLMKSSKYASIENEGSVKCADESIKIKDVNLSHSLMYYGTDKNGNIGAHFLPMTAENLESGMFQTTLLNVVADSPQYLPVMCDLTDCKLIVQGYQFIAGEQNIVNTIKYFNNGNKDSFNYNKDTVQFGEDMSIKNRYDYSFKENNGLYESDDIDLSKFIDSIEFEVN